MSESMASGDVIRRAIIRGFTRDDLIFMGELVDYSGLAVRVGVRAPTAVSHVVDAEVTQVAGDLGVPRWKVAGAILTSLFNAVRGGSLARNETVWFSTPDFPMDLKAHVGRQESGSWVLTVYEASEKPALA